MTQQTTFSDDCARLRHLTISLTHFRSFAHIWSPRAKMKTNDNTMKSMEEKKLKFRRRIESCADDFLWPAIKLESLNETLLTVMSGAKQRVNSDNLNYIKNNTHIMCIAAGATHVSTLD